jgi:hypothetical protein
MVSYIYLEDQFELLYRREKNVGMTLDDAEDWWDYKAVIVSCTIMVV